jgi:hypothetical protein
MRRHLVNLGILVLQVISMTYVLSQLRFQPILYSGELSQRKKFQNACVSKVTTDYTSSSGASITST